MDQRPSRWTDDAALNERIHAAAVELYWLVFDVAQWKTREDGMVYSDEPLEGHLREAQELVAWITRR